MKFGVRRPQLRHKSTTGTRATYKTHQYNIMSLLGGLIEASPNGCASCHKIVATHEILGWACINYHVSVTHYKCPYDEQKARNRSAFCSVLMLGACHRDSTILHQCIHACHKNILIHLYTLIWLKLFLQRLLWESFKVDVNLPCTVAQEQPQCAATHYLNQ